jgi:hypothetical protein
MSLKPRTESDEIKILRSLHTRMELSAGDKKLYFSLQKGYEGEVKFDKMIATAKLDHKFYKLDDLQLESNHSSFQIDSLLIAQHTIIPCEIKNFEGNYYYEKDNFYYYLTQKPITNPLHQSNRAETLLRQLFQQNGFPFPVEGYLNFINPQFYLYQAPFNDKIIYPTQQQQFLKVLATKPTKLNEKHLKVAEFLLQAHKPVSPYSKLPSYSYENLRKRIICKVCLSFSIKVGVKKIMCNDCGAEEDIEEAVLRSIDELQLLFPQIKITFNLVYDWCNSVELRRKIRRILSTNYQIKGHGKYAYYIKK